MRNINITTILVCALMQFCGITLRFPEQCVLNQPLSTIKPQETEIKTENFQMPLSGNIISPFGRRNGRRHTGIDIVAKKGTPIKASETGVVHFSGRRSGYGNIVILQHTNGYRTRYAHCSILLVKKGDLVASGQIIAKVGNTGRSTGAHLHFEIIKDGSFLDPLKMMEPYPTHSTQQASLQRKQPVAN